MANRRPRIPDTHRLLRNPDRSSSSPATSSSVRSAPSTAGPQRASTAAGSASSGQQGRTCGARNQSDRGPKSARSRDRRRSPSVDSYPAVTGRVRVTWSGVQLATTVTDDEYVPALS